MTNAPAPVFARAKATALKALADVQWDAPVPDSITFYNQGAFIIRLQLGNQFAQHVIGWQQLELAKGPIISVVIKQMLELLAQLQPSE